MSKPAFLVPLRFPLHGSRLIEASAGTGKTYTIAALYVRLVLGHGGDHGFGEPLLPPQILVVTFTEAATRELRERIRARLTEAAAHFRGESHDADAFLSELRADYPEELWGGCARRLEIAAEWMDEAAVSTIHAWCNRMLREHAFDSGSLFTQTLETDQQDLWMDVARDYWRTFVYPLERAPLERLLAYWKTPDALLRGLRDLLGTAAPPDADEDAAAVIETTLRRRAEALQSLKAPWAAWVDELADTLEQAAADKAFAAGKFNTPSRTKWIEALRQWRDDPVLEQPALTDTAWKRLTPDGLAEIWNPGFEPPDHPALHAIAALRGELRRLPDPQPMLRAHAAGWIRQRFRQEQQRRAQLGFDDLLTRLDDALHGVNGERLAAVIRVQFPVALIDEFQDTDPVQYRIFENVYRVADNRREQGLFLIGDPKQAIYAFRGADIYTYLRARKATADRHYTLARNFRSTAGVVEAVNRVFGQAEDRAQGSGAFMFREAAGNAVPFVEVQANGLAEQLIVEGEPQPALVCWHTPGGEPVAKGRYTRDMATSCAGEIVRLLNLGRAERAGFRADGGERRPLRPADIAVLVRDRMEAAAIREELAARRVRSVFLSDRESVFDSPEARDLLLWLKACAEPDVDRHLRAALATATLGLDWASLERLNQDEIHWEARVLQFRDYRIRWRTQGVLPMLRRLMIDFDVQVRLLRRADGERAATNLLHLAELLQRAAVELDGEQALVRFVAERLEQEGQAAEEQIVRLESDEALVKVVTIHKAKGMEYPLVFLPFICTFREVDGGKPPVRYHDNDGGLVIDAHPDDQAVARADQERMAEDLRLLYVAMTRACHACWLGLAPLAPGGGKTSRLHRSAIGYLLAGGESVQAGDLGGRLQELRGDCGHIRVDELPEEAPMVLAADTAAARLGEARIPERSAREYWWIASYSALTLVGETDNGPPEDAADPAPAPDTPVEANLSEADEEPAASGRLPAVRDGDTSLHRFPRGANPGIFLHGLLEWAAREGFGRVAADRAMLEDAVARRCNRRGWEHWITPLTGWMLGLLQTPLRLAEGEAVALQDLRSYQPELEFWFETRQVDAAVLDRRIRTGTLNGLVRPAVESRLLNGMLKGFIDLVFEHRGRYYVVDYKSNWLGEDANAYTADAIRDAVLEKRYDLQYVLYILALHRLLKARLPDYRYDHHIGGAVYLFLRGTGAASQGLHLEKPPASFIDELDAMFRNGSGAEVA
ncbi:MAG: exodeoxyribonuclease V subunit beta [Aquisalimonadaceae bacterium]